MTFPPGINIIICTYNRIDYLRLCLAPLLIDPGNRPFIVTVVDNNSSDGTADYLKGLVNRHNHLRYIREQQQGISHARNAGWKNTIHEWTLYLDDECVPGVNLINEALSLIQTHPDTDAIGGPIEAIYTDAVPDWLPVGFGEFKLSYKSFTSIDKQYLRGGCLMIKRKVFDIVGGFNSALGGVGGKLGYGEEIEMQHRMRKHAMKICYAPVLKIGHHVRTEKLSSLWVLHSEYARRRDKMFFEPVSPLTATGGIIRTTGGRLLRLPYYIYKRLFDKNYTHDHVIIDFLKPLMYRYGELEGSIKHFLGVRIKS